MKPTRTIFGIDLGTTFSAISWIDPYGKPEAIPNQEGERLTPSVVLFEEGNVIVGRAAAYEALARPDRAVTAVKRHMGDPDWIWECEGHFYRPQDISALILRKLRQDAERYTKLDVRQVVLTVPAYFSEQQRSATREAAELAGLEAIRLLNEPTAAALSYGYQASTTPGWMMVFDLGGGTFDVSLLEIQDDSLQVRATNGHAQLGGQDWDDLLLHEISVQFLTRFGIDPLDDPRAYQDIRERAIHAKHMLSRREKTNLAISHAGFMLNLELSRKQFEEQSQPLLGQIEDLCQLVLEDAGITWQDLNQIALVGGSTRMPMIQSLIQRLANKEAQTLLNPDEAVSLGAAIQGAKILVERYGQDAQTQQQEEYHQNIRRLSGRVAAYDVSSHSLGVVALDAKGQPFVDRLIPRYTPLPITRQEVYYTAHDHQISIEVRIMEGESQNPEECIELGTCELSGLPPRPAGQRIDVAFTYDLDGILSVELVDVGSGRHRRIEIQRGITRPLREVESMKRLLHSHNIS